MALKPVSVIKADLGINPGGRVHAFFTNTCYKHMDKYVPYSGEGAGRIHLRENVDVETTKIIYKQPYATIQYYGIIWGHPVEHYTTAGTGPYWDKRMWSAEKYDVIKEVQNYIDRGA